MQSAEDWMLLLRMGERLLDVLIGGACVYLGYRLFLALPEKVDSEGKIVLPGGINIWLSRVGPGAFFALFGAVLVGMSFMYGVEVKTGSSAGGMGPEKEAAAVVTRETRALTGDAGDSAILHQQRLAEAKNQLLVLNRDWPRALQSNLNGEERASLEIARDYSKQQILRAVWRQEWGAFEAFEQWVNAGAQAPAPSALSEAARLYVSGLEKKP
jgi:hypothetical protein